jgi:hypothetical protein
MWGGGLPPLPPSRYSNRTERGNTLELTDTQQEILVNAWLLARDGKGQVVADWAEPDAQQLSEAGWLERRTVDATGDTCWFWTQQAETALDMQALRRDDPADLN